MRLAETVCVMSSFYLVKSPLFIVIYSTDFKQQEITTMVQM